MPKRDKTLAAFGQNVAKVRSERGLSQDKLAEQAKLDRTYVSGIERGVRNPGMKVVILLERGLRYHPANRKEHPMPAGENWSRKEHILAFNLYSQIPFGTIHVRNPKIRELASLLGRSVGSVSYKLANFARLDPSLQKRGIRGAPHGAKGEEQVWNEFAEHPEELAFDSQRLLAEREGKPVEEIAQIETEDLPPAGRERDAIVKIRVNQSFFRKRVLSAYEFRCCVTGLSIKPLLVAGHIIPWAVDKKNRLNVRNGLCMNALHDRAFESHLMWIDKKLIVRMSKRLREEKELSEAARWLLSFDGKSLILPSKFQPDPKLLLKHSRKCQAVAS
jgi:putative restriction endonuclease